MSSTLTVFVFGITAFLVSTVLAPICLPLLRKLKIGQTVRAEGPQTHLAKNGTPTMGGVMIIIGFALVTGIGIVWFKEFIAPLAMTLMFFVVGFADDYIKVRKKQSEGLKPWQKMGLQILFTALVVLYMYYFTDISLAVKIPFLYGKEFNLGWFVIPFDFLVILGTDTGSNFTDGLDGLVSKVTLVILVFLFAVALKEQSPLIYPIAAFGGSLLSFLLFNAYPAKVFMGDTGSLAIGGFVAIVSIMLKVPVFILIFAFVYFAEVLSVIMQVGYFKISHGKRIFKMAPIHHHFEKCGWKETKVVTVFTVVTVILCAVAYIAL